MVGVVGCWGYVPWVVGDMFQVAGDMFRCDGGKTKSTPTPSNLSSVGSASLDLISRMVN